MNKMLLDSHIFLWILQEPDKLGPLAKILLSKNTSYVSAASIWELGIKRAKGRLAFSASELLGGVADIGAELLEISSSHIITATSLKLKHSDPFDHMLVAQAISERLPLLTCDKEILSINHSELRLIQGRL